MPKSKTTPTPVKEALVVARTYYRENVVPELADALPNAIALNDKQLERYKLGRRQGFDRLWVMPPVAAQVAHWEQSIMHLGTLMIMNVEPDEQYLDDPSLGEEQLLRRAPLRNRPEKSSYLLMYRSGPIEASTRFRNPPDLIADFDQHGWNGLTPFEYALVQRLQCEEVGDHRWDSLYKVNGKPANVHFLLDLTIGEGKQMRVAIGYYRGKLEMGFVNAMPARPSPDYGATPTIVVPLGK